MRTNYWLDGCCLSRTLLSWRCMTSRSSTAIKYASCIEISQPFYFIVILLQFGLNSLVANYHTYDNTDVFWKFMCFAILRRWWWGQLNAERSLLLCNWLWIEEIANTICNQIGKISSGLFSSHECCHCRTCLCYLACFYFMLFIFKFEEWINAIIMHHKLQNVFGNAQKLKWKKGCERRQSDIIIHILLLMLEMIQRFKRSPTVFTTKFET